MGLFPSANDFKAGKGVEKDAPRKTGVGRFFELVGRDMNGMFLANLLACIGFLPVICLVYIGFLANSLPVMLASAVVGGILAGPALAGMYDTVLRALRDEAGYWWVTYRRAFKRNFKASIAPGIFYCVVVTAQIFLVYFCFNMLSKGTNVGVPLWVATVLNLLIFQMLFAYMWPQVVLLDQPFSLTVKNSINCMIAFLPHALAAAIVQILFWGVVILCMPLGLLLMLIFGFWFVTEVSCQIIYGDIEKVFHMPSWKPPSKRTTAKAPTTPKSKFELPQRRGAPWNNGIIWFCRAPRPSPAGSWTMWRWTAVRWCWTVWRADACSTAATPRRNLPCRPSAT